MQQAYIGALKQSQLAAGFSEQDLADLLRQGTARRVKYRRGEIVFHDGDEPKKLFILLSGHIRIQKDTLSGRQILIADIERPGDMFGEIYLFIARRAYDMYAEAVRDTEVLELSNELFTLEQGQSGHLSALLRQNLLRIFAGKAYFMNNRLKVLASGSLRGKITRYLFQLGAEQGEIELPVGREELAALLAATRPSLSRELSAMQADGILAVQGKKIRILDIPAFEAWL